MALGGGDRPGDGLASAGRRQMMTTAATSVIAAERIAAQCNAWRNARSAASLSALASRTADRLSHHRGALDVVERRVPRTLRKSLDRRAKVAGVQRRHDRGHDGNAERGADLANRVLHGRAGSRTLGRSRGSSPSCRRHHVAQAEAEGRSS